MRRNFGSAEKTTKSQICRMQTYLTVVDTVSCTNAFISLGIGNLLGHPYIDRISLESSFCIFMEKEQEDVLEIVMDIFCTRE